MAGSRLRDGPARARDAPNMRLEKYEPGLDEPTCQDVHMPALSIPPGQAFLVKVELSPPPATGVMGTIGQLLGGGEDDQKDPVARMFKVGRQTHPILRLENPFSTRQVQAKVYICVLERAGTATEHEGSHDSGPMPPPHEMLRELSASLLKALRDPDETDALLSRACRMRGQLGLRPQAPRQTRTPAVVSGQPVSGEAKWGAGSPAMLLEFAMPKQALESAIQIHGQAVAAANRHVQWMEMAELLLAAAEAPARRGAARSLQKQVGVAKCSIAAGRSTADWEQVVRDAELSQIASCEAKLETASARAAAELERAVADARREERAKLSHAVAAARAADAAAGAEGWQAAAADTAAQASAATSASGAKGFTAGGADSLGKTAREAQACAQLAQARADAEMRVAKLEEQLLDVRKQLQTAQVHADLAFRALQLGVRLGPGKSRREESEE